MLGSSHQGHQAPRVQRVRDWYCHSAHAGAPECCDPRRWALAPLSPGRLRMVRVRLAESNFSNRLASGAASSADSQAKIALFLAAYGPVASLAYLPRLPAPGAIAPEALAHDVFVGRRSLADAPQARALQATASGEGPRQERLCVHASLRRVPR